MFKTLRQGARYLFRRNRMHDDIHRELDAHLEMEIERRVAQGMPPAEARRTALRDFGGVTQVTEAVRDARGLTFWDTLVQDVRYGLRTLRRSPGFTLAAILTLGFGIGANTAMFSVVNGALLHPLPYAESHRLIRIVESAPVANRPSIGVSIPETWEYRSRLANLQDLVEYHSMTFVLLDGGNADRVNTGVVSSQFFDVFGIKPLHGRTFSERDEQLGAPAVLVLGHEYWQSRFGGDPNVVGRTVQMNDQVHTIVGVMPPIPQYPRTNDVFMPTSACPFRASAQASATTNRRAFGGLSVFARLKPGATVEQVSADVSAMAAGWAQEYPQAYQPVQTGFTASVQRLDDQITQNARPILLTLVAATALVLLIACANVANLSLARTLQRDRELALRAALGAGRHRLVRQLLTESAIVSAAGGLLGLLLAWPTAGLIARFASRFTPRAVDASIDWSVLVFTLGVALLTALLFGLIPALSSRRVVAGSLRDGGAQTGDGTTRTRMRSALVVAQVMVCFALVVGASLFLRSLHRLSSVETGISDPEHLLTAELWGNFSKQTTAAEFVQFHDEVLRRVQQQTGVVSAAITNASPFNGAPGVTPFSIDGQADESALRPTVDQNVASPDYFATMGVPIVGGRAFDSTDRAAGEPVAIINQSMAKYWKAGSPIGRTFKTFGTEQRGQPTVTTYTVVGIAADIRQYTLDQAPIAQFFTPLSQTTGFAAQVLMRTKGDPHRFIAPLKSIVQAVDDAIPVSNVSTAAERRETLLQSPRLSAMLLTVFAALAFVITLAGVAAVIATSVSQRTREFGVRMALGASRASVLAMVVRQGALLIGTGLVLGVGGALAFSRILSQYLYQTPPTDPTVYAAVAVVVLVAGMLACVGPARRATSVDPLKALRTE